MLYATKMKHAVENRTKFFDVDLLVSKRMSRVCKADTKPEMAVRRLMHRQGYRSRQHRKDLSITPDLVPKLTRNLQPYAEAPDTLREAGYEATVIWEYETCEEAALCQQLKACLGSTRR